MSARIHRNIVKFGASVVLSISLGLLTNASAQQNGTTLAGYKTIDICSVSDSVWRYSGVLSVWNSGAIDTTGLAILDRIESKISGPRWTTGFNVPITLNPSVIPAGTTQETAITYPYSVEGAPLSGSIRNVASIKIENHSGSLGSAFGPEPKATFAGTVAACPTSGGCSYTQGYWGNKPGVTWPSPFSRDSVFYLSGQSWQQVMDTPVNVSQGYYQLSHQFIAATLNKANGAIVPSGVQDTLTAATAWLTSNAPSACTANGSCGTQKTWAAILDLYNRGFYPSGPSHCGDE